MAFFLLMNTKFIAECPSTIQCKSIGTTGHAVKQDLTQLD